jgi:hypothetical protein
MLYHIIWYFAALVFFLFKKIIILLWDVSVSEKSPTNKVEVGLLKANASAMVKTTKYFSSTIPIMFLRHEANSSNEI